MPQVATFYIGDELFGVDILMTKEMGKIQEITEVPSSPDFILGLMNLRGQIVTLMDPGVFLDQNSLVEPAERRLIIIKNESELEELRRHDLIDVDEVSEDTIALVIDLIGDVIEVETEEILPPPPNLEGRKKEFVEGIIQTEKQLIILLDISKLINMCVEKSEQ